MYFPVEGGWYDEKAVLANADITWSRDSPPCRASDPYSVTVYINSKRYKANLESVRNFILGDSTTLIMVCTGGAPLENGTYAADIEASINAENVPWSILPQAQKMNLMNGTLDDCASGNRIIYPFISGNVYCEAMNQPPREEYKQKLRCMGACRIAGLQIMEGQSIDLLRNMFGYLGKGEQSYARFREQPFRCLVLEKEKGEYLKHLPRLNPKNPEEIIGEEGWKVLTVTNCPSIKPTADISREKYKNCLSLYDDCTSVEDFAKLHMDAYITPLVKDLPKAKDIKFLTDNDPSTWLDSKAWVTAMKSLRSDWLPRKIAISDMIKSLIAVSYVGCSRYIGDCISTDESGIEYAHPLPNKGQGTVLQYHATPMPSRTADVASIIAMNACLSAAPSNNSVTTNVLERSTPYQRIQRYQHLDADFIANFFRCVICSIYGQTEGLTNYIESGDCPDGIILPSHEHAESFAKHMAKYCEGTNVSCAYYRDQYTASIPDALRNNKATALYFIRELGKNWEDEMNKYFGDTEWLEECNSNGNLVPSNRRDLVVRLAVTMQQQCSGEKVKDFGFIAHQAISAMEEIYSGEPFGKVDMSSVPVGTGSIAGIAVLAQIRPNEEEPKRRKATHDTATDEMASDFKWLEDALTQESFDKIMVQIKALSQEELTVLTFFRNDDDEICSMINGSPLNAVDVEHFPCKEYIVLRAKTPVSLKTDRPSATSRCAWPVRTTDNVRPFMTCRDKNIFTMATQAWETLVTPTKIWTPAPFLFRHELADCQHPFTSIQPQASIPAPEPLSSTATAAATAKNRTSPKRRRNGNPPNRKKSAKSNNKMAVDNTGPTREELQKHAAVARANRASRRAQNRATLATRGAII